MRIQKTLILAAIQERMVFFQKFCVVENKLRILPTGREKILWVMSKVRVSEIEA